MTDKVLWYSLYGQYAAEQGGIKVRLVLPFAIHARGVELLTKATEFLYSIKSINTPKMRPEAVMPEFTDDSP